MRRNTGFWVYRHSGSRRMSRRFQINGGGVAYGAWVNADPFMTESE